VASEANEPQSSGFAVDARPGALVHSGATAACSAGSGAPGCAPDRGVAGREHPGECGDRVRPLLRAARRTRGDDKWRIA